MHIREANLADYPKIMEIWEGAVKATHDFLAAADFELFKKLIPTEFLPQLRVFILEDQEQAQAFFSVSEDNLEMLFVDPSARGKGYGKFAIAYVVEQLAVRKVDVNEQNEQAVGFYRKVGYKQIGRSEKDGMGKNYPLIHMEISA